VRTSLPVEPRARSVHLDPRIPRREYLRLGDTPPDSEKVEMLSREERLVIFRARFMAAPRCESFEAAFAQLAENLNAVEDEYSGTAFSPDNWELDGRLYPPHLDSRRKTGRHGVMRFRSRKHNVLIGVNGAVEISDTDGREFLSKPGLDGRKVWIT